MNDRKPLLNLPVEILGRILEYIPDPIDDDFYDGHNFRPFWQHTVSDSLMLIPITHTCRQLREIALSTPLLWSTVIASPLQEVSSAQAFVSELMSRNRDVPLRVLLSPSKQFTKLVDGFYPMHARRVEELHLSDVGHRHMKYLESLLSHESPLLKSYSFDGRAGSLSKWHTHALPLPPNSAPALRDLHIDQVPLLPEVPLPALTHLALCNINLPGIHGKIARVVRSCPNLVTLILSNDVRLDVLDQDPEPLRLQHLRRLTLNTVDAHSLEFYLTLIPPANHQIALQVLNYQIDIWAIPSGPELARCIQGPIRTLAFGSHRVTSDFTVSVTGIASNRAFHIVSSLAHSRRTTIGQWLDRLLGLAAAAHTFWAVREVWVTHGDQRWSVHSETVAAAIASLHMLDTIVFVRHRSRQAQTVEVAPEPDLSLCPDAEDPSFNSPLLKTVRIVCYSSGDGDDGQLGEPERRSSGLQVLTFAAMLEQLKSGAKYRYLDRLVVQTDRGIVPIQDQVEKLREYIKEVLVETVDQRPTIPLPAICNEPRTGPGGDFRKVVAGALW
ncbi:hypothetical protein LXA43DRAFT_193722 [Ganoderma leucocontextum]|nr:hypothetical protein LXA43DRAFT_193722 [Ganoderma leucocontextum]